MVLGGTTSALLKLRTHALLALEGGGVGSWADVLVIDEASMMPAPHMVALAGGLLKEQGRLMLGGDHR